MAAIAPSPTEGRAHRRLTAALRAVLPATVPLELDEAIDPACVAVRIGPLKLVARWMPRGSLRSVREAIALEPKADLIVAPSLSSGARAALAEASIGWVEESGAAELVSGTVVVSRTGGRAPAVRKPPGWTPVTLSVAEAILCGTKATVSATAKATGHSPSSTAQALAALTGFGLLDATASRGRHSGRLLADPGLLLESYSEAAQRLRPSLELRCGMLWRDPLAELERAGGRWNDAGVAWALTGTFASAVLAPHLAATPSGEVYVDAPSAPALLTVARQAGLEPLDGGRLVLRPFPTSTSSRLAKAIDGVIAAPWPRVYADLMGAGVRGEEAAEHLREVVGGG